MNEHFVSIKVDREERPDLDHIYQNVVQMLCWPGWLATDDVPHTGARALLRWHVFSS